MKNSIFVFKITGEMPGHHSVPNQGNLVKLLI